MYMSGDMNKNTDSNSTTKVRYDNLTGLPDRKYFYELAKEGCKKIAREGGRIAFLFLDLSGMKFYNHRHGFEKGDALLVSFSNLLTEFYNIENYVIIKIITDKINIK